MVENGRPVLIFLGVIGFKIGRKKLLSIFILNMNLMVTDVVHI